MRHLPLLTSLTPPKYIARRRREDVVALLLKHYPASLPQDCCGVEIDNEASWAEHLADKLLGPSPEQKAENPR